VGYIRSAASLGAARWKVNRKFLNGAPPAEADLCQEDFEAWRATSFHFPVADCRLPLPLPQRMPRTYANVTFEVRGGV
jgi:hypothetical protein